MFEKYSDSNPVNQVPLTYAKATQNLWHALATCAGAGSVGKGAGTLGTVIGALLFIVLSPSVSQGVWLGLVALFFVLGAIASQKLSDALGVDDHGGIIIDEVVAIWLVYALIPAGIGSWLLGFIAFRIFDIVKLPPVSSLDEKLKNGWGIMLDDILAALYAIVVVQLLLWLFS